MNLLGAVAVAALGALWYYAARVEARRFALTRVDLAVPDWPAAFEGLTILHITDLHTRRWGPTEEFITQLARSEPLPDLVVLTGDCIEGRRGLEPCLRALSTLRAALGCYAVLGNNDLIPMERFGLVEGLEDAGFRVLQDGAVRLEREGQGFWLGGLRFYNVRRTPDGFERALAKTLAQRTTDEPLVLLSHTPEAAIEAALAGVPLMICGHTHGGQICLPGGRAVHNNLYRFRPPALTQGLCRHGDTQVFISRGLGMTLPTLRAWCPPEAVWLTLRRA